MLCTAWCKGPCKAAGWGVGDAALHAALQALVQSENGHLTIKGADFDTALHVCTLCTLPRVFCPPALSPPHISKCPARSVPRPTWSRRAATGRARSGSKGRASALSSRRARRASPSSSTRPGARRGPRVVRWTGWGAAQGAKESQGMRSTTSMRWPRCPVLLSPTFAMFDRPSAVPAVPPAFGRVLAHLDGRDGHDRAVQLVVTDRLVLFLNAGQRGAPFERTLEAVAPHRSLTVARLFAADTGWFSPQTRGGSGR